MIIKKTSVTNQEKLNDLLLHTIKNNDCMEWKGCFNTDGYPRMAGNVKVHRLVKQLETNEDITGYVVRHSCDNIKCIFPKHLLKGTVYENVKDRDERQRTHRVITKDIVFKTKQLLNTNLLSQKEIALVVGINPRRVSDIFNQRYTDEATFIRQ